MSLWSPEHESGLKDALAQAFTEKRRFEIVGHGTKRGYGRPVDEGCVVLDVSRLSGIVEYRPEELMVTVRPGTPLAALEIELAQHRQCLAFEPADWGPALGSEAGGATIGGIVGAGVSGPRRIRAGAARDHVMGGKGISGLGLEFVFGAKVVKNVTGFDLPKLLTGSLGTLAVLSEITLRVGPLPQAEATLAASGLDDDQAIALLIKAGASGHDISGAAHWPGTATLIRVEGPAQSSVLDRAKGLAGLVPHDASYTIVTDQASRRWWQSIREVQPLARHDSVLWRLTLPPAQSASTVAAIRQSLPCSTIYDQGGGLIWLEPTDKGTVGDATIRAEVAKVGGEATLFRAPPDLRSRISPFHPESPARAKVSGLIKSTLDPMGLFGPGRLAEGR